MGKKKLYAVIAVGFIAILIIRGFYPEQKTKSGVWVIDKVVEGDDVGMPKMDSVGEVIEEESVGGSIVTSVEGDSSVIEELSSRPEIIYYISDASNFVLDAYAFLDKIANYSYKSQKGKVYRLKGEVFLKAAKGTGSHDIFANSLESIQQMKMIEFKNGKATFYLKSKELELYKNTIAGDVRLKIANKASFSTKSYMRKEIRIEGKYAIERGGNVAVKGMIIQSSMVEDGDELRVRRLSYKSEQTSSGLLNKRKYASFMKIHFDKPVGMKKLNGWNEFFYTNL